MARYPAVRFVYFCIYEPLISGVCSKKSYWILVFCHRHVRKMKFLVEIFCNTAEIHKGQMRII